MAHPNLECIHLYLETNGTIWEDIQSGEMIFYEEGNLKIMTYFPNNKIVIKDIALGTGHKYAKCPNPSLCLIVDSAHCLAVDTVSKIECIRGDTGTLTNMDNVDVKGRVIHCVIIQDG